MRNIHLAKIGKAIECPEHKDFSPAVQQYLQDLGLRKALEGAMNDVNTKGETGAALAALQSQALGLAQKKLDSLIAGVVKTRVIGEADPVARQARLLAITHVQKDAEYKAWVGANAPGKANEQAARDELYRRVQEVQVHPKVVAMAEAMVAASAGLSALKL